MTRRSGFTILEVLLALALVAALAGGMMSFMWGLFARRDAMEVLAARQQGAGMLLERIESDVMCGIAGDARNGAGISGSSTRLVFLTRGVWMPTKSGPGAAMGDLQGSEYLFEDGEIRSRRWAGGDEEAGDLETACEGVELLRIRYFDGESWSASFDSVRAGDLPVAIEVAIWFGTPQPVDENVAALEGDGGGEQSHELPARDPDRVRLIAVADGPVTAWKESR